MWGDGTVRARDRRVAVFHSPNRSLIWRALGMEEGQVLCALVCQAGIWEVCQSVYDVDHGRESERTCVKWRSGFSLRIRVERCKVAGGQIQGRRRLWDGVDEIKSSIISR